jgi:Subtilisin inhibitor-like
MDVTALATAVSSLTILVYPQGMDGSHERWTLRCGPTGGSHPSAVAACRKLNSVSQPFKPVPKTAVCTAIYGGPDVAIVSGTFRGRRVWAKFRLADGCQIARWKRLVPMLPPPGA